MKTRMKVISTLISICLIIGSLSAGLAGVSAADGNMVKIGDTEYATFCDALAAAQAGDTIVFLRDGSGNCDNEPGTCENGNLITIPADKTITVDLAGYQLRATTSTGFLLVNNGNLTIDDTSVEGTGLIENTSNVIAVGEGVYAKGGILNNAGATLTVNGGTIKSSSALHGIMGNDSIYGTYMGTTFNPSYGIKNIGGTVIINDGTIEARFAIRSSSELNDQVSSLTINGGTIIGSTVAIDAYIGASIVSAELLTITAGTITATQGPAIAGDVGENSAVVITGGNISGTKGGEDEIDDYAVVEIYGGTFEMSGGTITGTADAEAGTSYPDHGLYLLQSNCTATITGGTINNAGGFGGVTVNEVYPYNTITLDISGNTTVTGGTLSLFACMGDITVNDGTYYGALSHDPGRGTILANGGSFSDSSIQSYLTLNHSCIYDDQTSMFIVDPLPDFQLAYTTTLSAIEPWSMKFAVTVTLDGNPVDCSTFTDFGFYICRMTDIETKRSSMIRRGEKVSYIDGGITANGNQFHGFANNIFTYEFVLPMLVMFYIEIDDGIFYGEVKNRQPSVFLDQMVASGLYNDDAETIDMLYSIQTLAGHIWTYIEEVAPDTALETYPEPALVDQLEDPLGAPAPLNDYSYRNGVQLRICEPWGIKLSTMIYRGSTAINYDLCSDYGFVVVYDSAGQYSTTPTLQTLLADESAMIYSKSTDTAYIENSFIVAHYTMGLYTWQLDTNSYVIAFAVINGNYYYGAVKTRNICDIANAMIASGTYVTQVDNLLIGILGLYDSTIAYRSKFGL